MTEPPSEPSDGKKSDKKVPELSSKEKEALEWTFYGLDDSSTKEAQLFESGASISEIKKKAEEREGDRAERFRDHFETVSIIALWGVFIIFMMLTIVWTVNQIIPDRYVFLDKGQLDKLQILITSGFVTGIASSHIKKRLS